MAHFYRFIWLYTNYREHFHLDLWYPRRMPRFSKRTDADRGPLGRLLYAGRRAAGLNVEACAATCGLSVGFLHFVEQGRRTPALAQMLGIADAYKVDRRQAAWAWILQTAPDVAIYLVSHETVASEPMLQQHFTDRYKEQVRLKEEARKATNAAHRAAVNQRQAARLAQKARVQAEIDKPMPTVAAFGHHGYQMVGPQAPQRDSEGVLAPWEAPDSNLEGKTRK